MKLPVVVKENLENIKKIVIKFQGSKLLNKILTVFSFIYPLILIGISWKDIIQLNFRELLTPFIYSFLLASCSLILQALNWTLIVNNNFSNLADHVEIYLKTLLMRRLPGGFWHWVGRVNLYHNSVNEPKKRIAKANTNEFLGLILSGLTCYMLIKFDYWGILVFIISYFVLFFLSRDKDQKQLSNYLVPLFLMTSYLVCWLLGGFILHKLLLYVSPEIQLSISTSISFWIITGTIGTIIFFMPFIGMVRELSLTALLSPYLDFSKIILLSLLIRLILYLSDIAIALIGLLLIKIFNRKPDN